MPGGGYAVVCAPGRRRRCSVCGNLGASKLCDGPPPPGSRRKTCDAALCVRCAKTAPGRDTDFCPRCAPTAPELDQLPLDGIKEG